MIRNPYRVSRSERRHGHDFPGSREPMATVGGKRSAWSLAVAALLALWASPGSAAGQEAAVDPLCADGSAVVAAEPLARPLPSLEALREICADFEPPRVKFLIGRDGRTYYLYFDRSAGCAAADAELRRWLGCWTYEPARCGAEAVAEEAELELDLPADPEWGPEPPCERDDEASSPAADEEETGS